MQILDRMLYIFEKYYFCTKQVYIIDPSIED